jgi:hypothetical protein
MPLQPNVKTGIALASLGGALAATSVFLYLRAGWLGREITGGAKAFQLMILCLWIVLPPVWFAVELNLVKAGKTDDEAKEKRDEMRKNQEVFARVWLGVSAMLGVLASALLKRM